MKQQALIRKQTKEYLDSGQFGIEYVYMPKDRWIS